MLKIVQFVKINGFQRFFFIFPSQWVTRLPDLVIFRRFSKMKTQTIFSTLASRTCFILHIIIVLIVLNHLTTTNYLSGWHKYAKCGQLCIKKFKITIFYQFFDFHCLNTHDIAAYDSTNDNGEGGITNSFILFFRSRKRATENLPTMTKMEMMMGKGGGITNRFVLFLG